MRSTIGISQISPGPFARTRRPRRKMTPRSYSRATLTMDEIRENPMIRTMTISGPTRP